MRYNTLVILLLFCSLYSQAQTRYTLRHFTNENGLPVNGIKGMVWDDEHQLLWIGTDGGIVYWNGQYFTSVPNQDRVWQMGTFQNGNTRQDYVLSDPERIYYIQGSHISYAGPLKDSIFLSNLSDTSISLLKQVIKGIGTRRDRKIWPSWSVPLDPQGNSVLLSLDNNVYLTHGAHADTLLQTEDIYARFFTTKDEILLADYTRLYIYDKRQQRFRLGKVIGLPPVMKDYSIITNTNTTCPVIYGHGKLFLLSKQGEDFRATLLYDQLPNSNTITMAYFLGSTGNIAIGDKHNGIYMLKSASVYTVNTSLDSSESDVTYGQALLPDGKIILHNGTVIGRGQKPYKHDKINSYFLFHSSGNYIFYSRTDTVFRYDKRSGSVHHYPLHDKSQCIFFAETAGKLYVLSNFSIYSVHDTNLVHEYSFSVQGDRNELIRNKVTIEARKGVLAIGGSSMIYHYHTATHRMDSIPVTKGIPIRTLYQTGEYLFMGTYGEGIYVLKGGKVSSIPLDKMGYLRYAHSFVPDNKGYCYISSNNGIFKVSMAALISAASSSSPIYYHYLGKTDGLTTTEMNGSSPSCVLRLPDGTLSFASMNGLGWLHPDSVYARPPNGIILIDSVLTDNESFSYKSKGLLSLNSSVQNVNINISIPYWGSNENLYTWYRLLRKDGNDTTWRTFNSVTQQHFSFTALKPDEYKFEVKVLSGFEPGEAKYLSVPFTILRPWYLQWYGIILWAVLLVVFIMLLIKWRLAHLNRRTKWLGEVVEERTADLNTKIIQLGDANHLKERLISVISHNIITPLKYIYETSADLGNKQQQLSPRMQVRVVASIKTTSKELELLSVNLLNWIKMQHKDYANLQREQFLVNEVIQQVFDLLHPIAIDKGVKIVTEINHELQVIQYKDALQVILYNLVLNAVLHSGKGNITISCFQTNDEVIELNVVDEGEGMPESKVRELMGDSDNGKENNDLKNKGHGFGYLIIKDLLKLIDGTLQIESRQDVGTRVTILFKA